MTQVNQVLHLFSSKIFTHMLEKGIEVEPGESRIRHKHITFIIVIDLYWVYGHL